MAPRVELQGRRDWQEQIYRRYHRKVFAMCLYFLKNREEANDACHDVFLKVFKGWKEFEWQCDPITWMGAIARNDCFSRIKRRKRELDRREQLAIAEWERVIRNREAEEDKLLCRLRMERSLPQAQGRLGEILRLHLEQGLNHREIALHLGMSRVAVTRRLSRFRKKREGLFSLSKGRAQREAFPSLPDSLIRLRAA